jgi:hypothetical protein
VRQMLAHPRAELLEQTGSDKHTVMTSMQTEAMLGTRSPIVAGPNVSDQ